MKLKAILRTISLLTKAMFFSLLLFHVAYAQQAGQLPAIIVNNSSGPIDYYVILNDGSPQYVNSLDQGMQTSDNFYVGEQILITPRGSQDVIADYTYDGTINAVLSAVPEQSGVNSSHSAAPPRKSSPAPAPISAAAPNSQAAGNQVAKAPPAKPSYQPSQEFKDWLATDKPNYEERSKNSTTYQAGHRTEFKMEDQMRKGYHIFKMDPSRLTSRGLGGNAPDLVKKLGGESLNWGLRELKFAMPNDLVLLPEQGRTRGVEHTSIMFTSDQERKSTSVNVGASLDAKKASGSGKIGISREESKFESNNKSMIRKQIVGEAYWVIYAKEYMELADGFTKYLRNKNNLRNYGDFKNMFERYGTHWPVATLFGGYIRYDEIFDTKEMAESITKSLSVDISAKAPVPKAPSATVGGSVGFTQSDTNEMKSKESQGKASFESQGGQLGASFSMWNMASPTAADNYVPLKVELRGIDELIWPELMGIEDPKEAARIHALRIKTGKMLARFVSETQGINTTEDWNPRIYEVSITRAAVSQDDDEGSGNEPDFFGSLIVSEAKNIGKMPILNTPMYAKSKVGNNINHSYVWSESRGNAKTKGKGSTFSLNSARKVYISVPATAVRSGSVSGKPLYKPKFVIDDIVGYFESTMADSDDTGDDENLSGNFAISLAEVEKSPNKLVTREKEFADEGVGIKVKGQVKRMNYELQNSDFTLLSLPRLSGFNQGAAIAAKSVSGAASSVSSSSSNKATSNPLSGALNKAAGSVVTAASISNKAAASFSGFQRIQNRWYKDHYLHNQSKTLELGPMKPNWWSAQWTIEPVAGTNGFVRIRNRWFPQHALHNQNGKLELGPIKPNWWSAQWKIVPVSGQSEFVRIQNRWYPDHYIHNQSQKLELGPMKPNWWSAQWRIK